MCDAPGDSRLRFVDGRLHGYILCGCGPAEVAITLDPNGERTFGVPYTPRPDLRRADIIAEVPSA